MEHALTLPERAQVAIEVYDICLNHLPSFEVTNDIEIGANLAYLMGAILKGERFEAWIGVHEDLIVFFQRYVPIDHTMWSTIDLMGGDEALPEQIKRALLAGCAPGNLDGEDYPDVDVWFEYLKSSCECDNTHQQNDTVCQWCWAHGRRHWLDPDVREKEKEHGA